ncbi:class I SAM-dependent methyltransferase [Paenibacillus sp. BSR1-1]|uniref:class I SAM-dependent methyltransferase n=1 Tax=Paenibacillus sp. BSR1-1 TaxID=3020845 RepID=UPI0025AF8165|nr:class I SAM-dependent methyltransferase [Paenibacillus sp. BSR1-1]MDN3016407.1 class I SAM-dependent methyltransferase [Paenibacillus sp. BSR1-1]
MDTKTKWNLKHKERIEQLKEPGPNPRLKNLSPNLSGGTALDLACGLGGNSFFLARMNYSVEAMDISDVAINYIHNYSVKNNLKLQPKVTNLTDLTNLKWPNSPYDLIVISYYLDRSLFPIVKNLIREDGYFFMETYYQSPLDENQRVSNQYKLESKELLAEFCDWKVVFFEEIEKEGRQTIFCKKC